MEVSDYDSEPSGHELIDQLVELTGLPDSIANSELDQILERSGQNRRDVSLEQLRQAMVAYLEEFKDHFSSYENTAELEQ